MRVVVVGASGTIGSAVVAALSARHDVVAVGNKQGAIRVDLDTLTPEMVQGWKQGDRLLLNGKMLTGRDAAHKRIADMLAKGEPLPVEFKGRVIYYVGPVDPVRDEVVIATKAVSRPDPDRRRDARAVTAWLTESAAPRRPRHSIASRPSF